MALKELEKLLGVTHATSKKAGKPNNPPHRIIITRKRRGEEFSLKIKGVNGVIVTRDKDYILNSPPLELMSQMLGRKVSAFEGSAIIRSIVKIVDID